MKTEITCKTCGRKTIGDDANYCTYCGSPLKEITVKQKLVVMQEICASPEEIEKLIKRGGI